jgi:hypothetical protein
MSTIAIIAGGRDLAPDLKYNMWLTLLDQQHTIVEVVEGGANGADAIGKSWALNRFIKITTFKADWNKYGRGAGPIRNMNMAEYLLSTNDVKRLCILFPGGKGTASMKKIALDRNIEVVEYK